MRRYLGSLDRERRVDVPDEILRHLGIEATDSVCFAISESGAVEVKRTTISDLYGIVPALPPDSTQDIDEQIREAMEDMADRAVRELEGR